MRSRRAAGIASGRTTTCTWRCGLQPIRRGRQRYERAPADDLRIDVSAQFTGQSAGDAISWKIGCERSTTRRCGCGWRRRGIAGRHAGHGHAQGRGSRPRRAIFAGHTGAPGADPDDDHGAVYPAIDLTAGERERGTLETLIAAPISRMALLIAKYMAVLTVAVLTAMVNLVAMTVTVMQFQSARAAVPAAGCRSRLMAEIFGLMVLFAAFFSAIMLAVTSFARSFKEAQAYLIPVMLLAISPGLLSLMPGLQLTRTVGGDSAGQYCLAVARPARSVNDIAGHGRRWPSSRRRFTPWVAIAACVQSFRQRRLAVCQPRQLVGPVPPPDGGADPGRQPPRRWPVWP